MFSAASCCDLFVRSIHLTVVIHGSYPPLLWHQLARRLLPFQLFARLTPTASASRCPLSQAQYVRFVLVISWRRSFFCNANSHSFTSLSSVRKAKTCLCNPWSSWSFRMSSAETTARGCNPVSCVSMMCFFKYRQCFIAPDPILSSTLTSTSRFSTSSKRHSFLGSFSEDVIAMDCSHRVQGTRTKKKRKHEEKNRNKKKPFLKKRKNKKKEKKTKEHKRNTKEKKGKRKKRKNKRKQRETKGKSGKTRGKKAPPKKGGKKEKKKKTKEHKRNTKEKKGKRKKRKNKRKQRETKGKSGKTRGKKSTSQKRRKKRKMKRNDKHD